MYRSVVAVPETAPHALEPYISTLVLAAHFMLISLLSGLPLLSICVNRTPFVDVPNVVEVAKVSVEDVVFICVPVPAVMMVRLFAALGKVSAPSVMVFPTVTV